MDIAVCADKRTTKYHSHPVHAVATVGERSVHGNGNGIRQYLPGISGINDPIVENTSAGVPSRIGFFDAINDWLLDLLHKLLWQGFFAFPLQLVLLHDGDNSRGLLSAHHRDLCAGPQESESRPKSWPTHRVIPRSKTASTNDRELGNWYIAHGINHLRPILCDPALLIGGPDDEPRDVVQEDQRRAALPTHLHKMRCLDGSF
mmetsp:Transcript_57983/g.127101  ORF Transcript_57983/g.127101 Transcript_57983/m.127101 type:complete len:203 (-) Transcript_57983:2028-2636(-)